MRIQVSLVLVLALCACKDVDGQYVPDCAAFAGDTIELHDGRFSWNRFTDEVRVDNDGNKIDPFPEFPKSGGYVLNGDRLELHADGDDAPQSYIIRSHSGRTYLLTSDQAKRYADDGTIARCALVREVAPKK